MGIIFSDKTGTLTQNIMTFKKCSVNGTIYGNPDPKNDDDKDAPSMPPSQKKLIKYHIFRNTGKVSY